MKTEIVITFDSTNQAIAGENSVFENGINASVMPLPSTLGAGCGMCLRVKEDEIKSTLIVLKENNVKYASAYVRTVINGKSSYSEYKLN